MIMPSVIKTIEMYSLRTYFFLSNKMPKNMLAIRDPFLNNRNLIKKRIEIKKAIYRSENHVQWHWNVEIKSVVIENADYEKHDNQFHVIPSKNNS